MGEEIILVSDEKNERLDSWIHEKMNDLSRSYIQKLIKDGQVIVNNKKVKSGYKISIGDKIVLIMPEPKELDLIAEEIDIDVLYEDSDIIVVNKPKGMVVHPAPGNYQGTLVNALLSHCKGNLSDINGVIRPGIVHRIDKNTSGSLVIAKNNNAHERLTGYFKKHDITRKYIAIVKGVIKENSGKIDMPIGRHPVDRKKMAVNLKNGRNAVTYFNVLERFQKNTFIEVTLETGRTHQIRVHMSHIGYPIVGDDVYGSKKTLLDIEGQVLHAQTIGFVHPTKEKYVEFNAKMPEYFQELLDKLGSNSL